MRDMGDDVRWRYVIACFFIEDGVSQKECLVKLNEIVIH